jgi:HTH-type transcriptional regulator/antitoxin HigA
MDIRPIRDETDLAWALAEVGRYFDAPPAKGTPEADRFDVLSTLIETYEDRLFETVDADDPVDFLTSFMAITGRAQRDLAKALGSPSRASEILRRQRALTLPMIRRLHEAWGLPADALLGRRAVAA